MLAMLSTVDAVTLFTDV